MSTPITAGMVNELRQRTGLPMMECKNALVHVGGDMDKAIDHIRVTVKGAGVKRAGNETAEGRVAVAVDGGTAAIVELRCESAPVAKNDLFVAYANQVAQAVVKHNPASVEALMATEIAAGKTAADGLTDLIGVLRENMKIHRFERATGQLFGSYVHHDGTLGVLVVGSGSGDPEVLRNLSMHVAAVQPTPVATKQSEVPAEVVTKELEIAKAKAEATGKPAQIAQKIAEGQMKTWYAENVLVEQPFVMDQSTTVGALLKGANLDVVKFVRYKVGEIVK